MCCSAETGTAGLSPICVSTRCCPRIKRERMFDGLAGVIDFHWFHQSVKLVIPNRIPSVFAPTAELIRVLVRRVIAYMSHWIFPPRSPPISDIAFPWHRTTNSHGTTNRRFGTVIAVSRARHRKPGLQRPFIRARTAAFDDGGIGNLKDRFLRPGFATGARSCAPSGR